MSLRVPSKETPPPCQIPLTEPLHRERCSVSRAFFYVSFKVPRKGAPSPRRVPTERDAPFPEPSFTRLSKSPAKKFPFQVPPAGPRWRETPITRAFFYISFRIPSKGAPPPPGSPLRASREGRSVSRAFFYPSLKDPGKGAPPPGSPTGPPWREMSIPRAFICISLGAVVKKSPNKNRNSPFYFFF
jgi:hypothetical protein